MRCNQCGGVAADAPIPAARAVSEPHKQLLLDWYPRRSVGYTHRVGTTARARGGGAPSSIHTPVVDPIITAARVRTLLTVDVILAIDALPAFQRGPKIASKRPSRDPPRDPNDQSPLNHNQARWRNGPNGRARDLRPRPALAARPASRARNSARLARGIRPRPVNGTCGPSGARVELEPLVRFASRGCGRPWHARAATELDWAIESKAVLDTPPLWQAGRGPGGSRGADRPRGGRPARHLWQDNIFCTVAGSCRIVAAQLPDSCRLCFT